MGQIQSAVNSVLGTIAAGMTAGKYMYNQNIQKQIGLKNAEIQAKHAELEADKAKNDLGKASKMENGVSVLPRDEVKNYTQGGFIYNFESPMAVKAGSALDEKIKEVGHAKQVKDILNEIASAKQDIVKLEGGKK